MPALPAVPNVVKVQLSWTVGADLSCYTNLYFRYSGGPPTATEAAGLAEQIFTALSNEKEAWDTDTVLAAVKVTDLSSTMTGEGMYAGAATGTRAGTVLPGSTCSLVNYSVARRYRGGKPRNYLPWGVESDLASRQRWSAAWVSAYSGTWQAFISAVIGAVQGSTTLTAHVNVSYYAGSRVVTSPTTGRARNVPILRSSPQVDSIVQLSGSVVLATQRRRNR